VTRHIIGKNKGIPAVVEKNFGWTDVKRIICAVGLLAGMSVRLVLFRNFNLRGTPLERGDEGVCT
jgi:hypothetical protein